MDEADLAMCDPTTPLCQFWANLSTQAALVVAAFGTIFVALFGDWLKAFLFSPKLKLTLVDSAGTPSPAVIELNGKKELTDSRWYHARVENRRGWPAATQLQVFLLRIEDLSTTFGTETIWTGEMPLVWKHAQLHPLAITLGKHPIDCDLCSVVKGQWVDLHPVIQAFAMKSRWPWPCHLAVTLHARSLETASNLLRIEIEWDGKWDDDTEKMKQHMKVKGPAEDLSFDYSPP
jgi:hypothetical protein